MMFALKCVSSISTSITPESIATIIHAYNIHDDVIKWNNFPRYFVWGIHRSPVNSLHKMPVTRSFDVFFDQRLNERLSKQNGPFLLIWFNFNPSLDKLLRLL